MLTLPYKLRMGMSTSPSRSGSARILVIDDDEIIGRVIARALGRHDVVCETDPRTALARIASGEWFDLVLCDMRMPGLSGMQVHAEIAATMPSVLDRLVFSREVLPLPARPPSSRRSRIICSRRRPVPERSRRSSMVASASARRATLRYRM